MQKNPFFPIWGRKNAVKIEGKIENKIGGKIWQLEKRKIKPFLRILCWIG